MSELKDVFTSYEPIAFDRVEHTAAFAVSHEILAGPELEAKRIVDDMRDQTIFRLSATVAAERIDPVVSNALAPATAWQHLKERRFPRRLRWLFQVRYELRGGHVVADRWTTYPHGVPLQVAR